ncbi:alpha/beta hydrolase [Limnohabitans sp. DCL3]|uniref:alpha/beta hydrolase n=1 Tax=Limnohabitans sp. DCL3 TaxID=3374103 RepID=UPI003A8A2C34
MRRSWRHGLLLCMVLCSSATAWAQAPTCAVVLMHGKWGTAQSPNLKPVVDKLAPICQVKMLDMPWSRHRLYDQPYADALVQIQEAVTALRQSGVQWVAVGGQSFGANATLAYMAHIGDADALLPMAAGHVPEVFYAMPDLRRSIDTARQKLESGRGSDMVEMSDINQGQRRLVQPTAQALWSYFNPQGWGNMRLSAAAFRKPVPVFWAIGTADSLYPQASAAIYNSMPLHPDSRYEVVQATHATTPEVASDALLAWVKTRVGR